jgi:CRP-like cAMP-binding protein
MNNTLEEKKDFFTSISLFQGLSESDLEDILLLAEPIPVSKEDEERFQKGKKLLHQGKTLEGMYFLKQGKVKLEADVPGNDLVYLGIVESGDIVGEVSVISGSTSLTSAEILEPISGYFLSNVRFDMLRASLKISTLNVVNRIRRRMCDRIRSRIAQIAYNITLLESDEEPKYHQPKENKKKHLPFELANGELSILKLKPPFESFDDSTIKAFLTPLRRLELKRGDVLYTEGSAADSCFIVVRGALRTTIYRDNKSHKQHREHLAVYGPTRIVGALALIDGGTRPTTCAACEQTTLLEMKRQDFEELHTGGTDIGFKFLDAVSQELSLDTRRLTRNITRLVSQEQWYNKDLNK